MKVTILGCGTSTGVPVPSCQCSVCCSKDPKNSRLRASILIETNGGKKIIVDTSSDFRQQVLRIGLNRVDAVLYTHAHADHILGLDDLRSYNFTQQEPIPCYATTTTWHGIERMFDYVFNPDKNYKGGGLAKIARNYFEPFDQIDLFGEKIETFQLMHGNMEVIGFKFGSFAYATDCNFIPEKSLQILKGVKILILDGLRHKPHATHFTLDQAVEVSKSLGVERAIFTHYTHSVDYHETNSNLPKGNELAFDGMEIEF